MTYSPLTNTYIKAKNFSSETYRKPISEITIHHMAGVMTAEQCGNYFANTNNQVSSNYGVGSDGKIGCYVRETRVAWCNSNWASNCRAISIEVSNKSTDANWPVSTKTFNALVKLVADCAKRNGLGKLVKGKNLTWHSMYAATSCPGPYLTAKLDELVQKANDINYPPEPVKEPEPVVKPEPVKEPEPVVEPEPVKEPEPEPEPTPEPEPEVKKSIWQIIIEFIINIFKRKS